MAIEEDSNDDYTPTCDTCLRGRGATLFAVWGA